MRGAADLPFGLDPQRGIPGLCQQPAVGDQTSRSAFFFSPDDRARRLTALIESETELDAEALKALAAGRLHGLCGEAARPVPCPARCARDDGRGRPRLGRGDRPPARLGRPVPERLAGRGRVRAVPPRLRLTPLRASLRRGRRPGLRRVAAGHVAARRGHRSGRRGDAARGARRRARRGRGGTGPLRLLGRHAPPRPTPPRCPASR